MDQAVLQKEDENKKKGIIVSFAIHVLLLLIALLPYFSSKEFPQEFSGIVVAFGAPEGGSSDANPLSNNDEQVSNDIPKEAASDDSKQKSVSTSKQKETSDPVKTKKPVSDLNPVSSTSDVSVEDSQREKAKREAEAAEADNKRRQAEEIAKREAQKKAEEEAKKAAYDESKSKFSDLFGTGKGNDNNDENAGNPKGDPNSDALNQVATGAGRIGGGLINRNVLFEPEINDNSQHIGIVVIKVCVNRDGKVVETKFTQQGSTTTNKVLVDIAVAAAKKYQFSPSEIETQCGNITIDFKVE
jgi:membrane protein involved in colicin uptake